MILAVPTIHLNGTSKQELLDGYINALDALREAHKRLAATCPNGRDYYPQGSEAINVAMQNHEGRMARIKFVMDELQEIAEAIC